jgi:carbonic anhydrase
VACAEGKEQSPVDIPASAPINPAAIVFNYQPSALKIGNNGHTIQVDYAPGSSIQIEGKTYNLAQFHFHAMSEHTFNGHHRPLEIHFVHKSDDGEWAVVGIMLNPGAENAAYAPVFNNLPAQAGDPQTISGVTVNAAEMLPTSQRYYRYEGSLTTPPCTEGINWFVLTRPVQVSEAQIKAFEQIYDNNYRPVQPLNERTFLSGMAAPEAAPATQPGNAPATEPATAPATMPTTGGETSPWTKTLVGGGLVLLWVGLSLRRRAMAE